MSGERACACARSCRVRAPPTAAVGTCAARAARATPVCPARRAQNRCERLRDGGASRAREHTWQLRVRSLRPAAANAAALEGRGAALPLYRRPGARKLRAPNPEPRATFEGSPSNFAAADAAPGVASAVVLALRHFAALCAPVSRVWAGTAPRPAKAVLPSRDSFFHRRAHRRSPGGAARCGSPCEEPVPFQTRRHNHTHRQERGSHFTRPASPSRAALTATAAGRCKACCHGRVARATAYGRWAHVLHQHR